MNDSEKNIEKGDSLGDVLGNIVETAAAALATVVENVAEAISGSSEPENPQKENQPEEIQKENKEEIQEKTPDLNREKRIGYAQSIELPQSEEMEEEVLVEADDKNEIEAAIARARETKTELAEEFRDELVAESLPALPRQNRARLQIQAPNRIHLYWSLSGNPFETLRKAFGNRADNYVLVTKLVNLQTGAESFSRAEIEGDWWYNVRSNSAYRADLGFYSPNRPFVRLISSNEITTPRPAPSAKVATENDWIVSTREFVKVLTASGYSHDVLNVAFQESGEISGDAATITVANRFAPAAPVALGDLNLPELRWVLVSLASGVDFAELREYVSAETAAWLNEILAANPDALEAGNVREVLESIFGGEFIEMFTEQDDFTWQRLAPVAVGASAIHFPEILFPKLRSSERKSAENPFAESAEKDFPFGLRPVSSDEFLFPTSPVFRLD